jgi:hypothetical protein
LVDFPERAFRWIQTSSPRPKVETFMVPPCQVLAGWITALPRASDLGKNFNHPHLTNVGASLPITSWIYCLCFNCNYKWLHPAKHVQQKDKTRSDELKFKWHSLSLIPALWSNPHEQEGLVTIW